MWVFRTSVYCWSFTEEVSSSRQDSSWYSDQSQQCCSLNGLDSSSNFQLIMPPFQAFGTVPSVPIIIGITVTFMFHSFLCSLATSKYSSFFSLSLIFTQWSGKVYYSVSFLSLSLSLSLSLYLSLSLSFFFCFLLIITRPGLLTGIRWSFCIWKFQRISCVSFSRMNSGLCIYNLVLCSNFNFLHYFRSITFPTWSCLVLYSFCASLLHSLIIWLMVSFLSSHNLLLLFNCLLLIFCFNIIGPYGVVLCCY